MAAAEGEKICSNLEQGVLNWFQRGENQKDAKRPSAEGLVRYHVTERCQKTECAGLGEVSCNRRRLLLQRLVVAHSRS